MAEYSVVLVTAPTKEEAQKLAKGILETKLAACVNIVGGVESHYWWQDKLEKADEALMVIKTRSPLVKDLASWIHDNHSYSVPEVIGMKIHAGNPDYLNWIGANTVFSKPRPQVEEPPL